MKKSAAVVAGVVMAMGMAAPAFADTDAAATTANTPGVLSGNVIQVPLHIPLNACSNTVDLIGLLNPAFGGSCLTG